MRRVYLPKVVEVEGVEYELHLGRPGEPRIYRRLGRTLKRVKAGDPVVGVIAEVLVEQRRRRRALAARFGPVRAAGPRHWLRRLLGRFRHWWAWLAGRWKR